MSLFNFTSGNPNNLVANQNASMADIQGPFLDLKTALNGNLDETNVPNLAAAYTTYKRIAAARTTTPASTNTFLLQTGFNATGSVAAGQAAATVANHAIYLDPAIYGANSRLTKLQLRAAAIPNAVAPAITF